MHILLWNYKKNSIFLCMNDSVGWDFAENAMPLSFVDMAGVKVVVAMKLLARRRQISQEWRVRLWLDGCSRDVDA